MTLVLAAALAAGLVAFGVLVALRPLLARSVSAAVNERSDHVVPTPQGGGIGVLAGLFAGLAVLAGGIPGGAPAGLALAAAALGVVGFVDDRRGLPAAARLAAQAGAVAASLALLPPAPPLLLWAPPALEWGVTAFALLWFVNLFNFMDGMDGLAGSEGLAIALGIALVGFGFAATGSAASLGVALALAVPLGGACLGFLALNRPPARLFLGDVGSLPLGLLFGVALLALARAGHPGPALLLPLVFVLDATLTLLKRLGRGEPVWRAHRRHAYQRARDRGLSAAAVLARVAAANAGLLALAFLAAAWPTLAPLAVAAGVALGLGLLAWLRGRAG